MSLYVVEGAVIAGRFRLVRKLGQGGMGEVWLARHLALEGLCAIKLIDPAAAASPELRARFVFEGKAAAQLRSAHVVQILDIGFHQGSPYIVMEHLEGEDLRARLERDRVLGARETASIITQVARALTLAHEANIVHRDLKPGNLFLCREGDREIVKVLDFGVAKHMTGAGGFRTAPDTLLGTVQYMSPEQVRSPLEVDPRSDLWALGVLAFRCLTGELPFKSTGTVGTLEQIVAGPIPVPSRIAPVPKGFDLWWARATSRDPAGRFPNAKDLAAALHMTLGLSGALDLAEPDLRRRLDPGVRLPIPAGNAPRIVPRPLVRAPRPMPPIHVLAEIACPPIAALTDDAPSPVDAPAHGVASPVDAPASGVATPVGADDHHAPDAAAQHVASPARALAGRAPSRSPSSPPTSTYATRPFATSIRPAAAATPKVSVKAKIAAAVAIVALSGLAAVSVSLGSSASVSRTLASSESGAPTGPLPIVLTADPVPVAAAERPSSMLASAATAPLSTSSADARSRGAVSHLPVKSPTAAPARRSPKPPAAPTGRAQPAAAAFEPGF